MRSLPHRYPFLLIDRIIEYVPNESAIAIKNVTVNEPYFTGHFPTKPVMPGVMIIEAMAQASLIPFLYGKGQHNVYLVSIDKARFRKPVVPGDQLIIKVEKNNIKSNIYRLKCTAFVQDRLVAEAIVSATYQK